MSRKRYFKPIVATGLFCTAAASTLAYSAEKGSGSRLATYTIGRGVLDSEVKQKVAFINRYFGLLPEPVRVGILRGWLSWRGIPPAEATVGTLIGINTVVFLMWQVPALKPFMLRHFTHTAGSGLSYTLFTSMFSHAGTYSASGASWGSGVDCGL
jgi:hypothetical protein